VELLCFVVIATGNLGKVVVITRSTLYVPVESVMVHPETRLSRLCLNVLIDVSLWNIL
jgi:hypothetical protein